MWRHRVARHSVYAEDNCDDSDKDGILDGRLLGQGDFGTATWEGKPSVPFPAVPAMSAAEALAHVSAHAGASLWRDPVDDYVMKELASYGKSGKTISDEASLGIPGVVGELPGGSAPKDTDRDGMPDAWEVEKGSTRATPATGTATGTATAGPTSRSTSTASRRDDRPARLRRQDLRQRRRGPARGRLQVRRWSGRRARRWRMARP